MATNDITGDRIVSKANTKEYRDGWETAFGGVAEKSEDRVRENDPGTKPGRAVHEQSDTQHRADQDPLSSEVKDS